MAHQHGHGHGHGHGGADSADVADLLDLDAQVLSSYLAEVTSWVQQLALTDPARVVDLGAGTGTGTVALAQRFPGAQVIALDQSEQMLTRVRATAAAAGLGARVTTLAADLNTGWPDVGPVDLAWAAPSLHEMTDPDRVLRDVLAALRPGGLVAVTEMDAPPRFLPHDVGIGRPGLEERCHEALARTNAPTGDAFSHPDWTAHLTRAGYEAVTTRTFTIDVAPPAPAATGRYAGAYLARIRPFLREELAAEDQEVLDVLLAEHGEASLLHRSDLQVRGTRSGWVARRPA